MLKMIAFKWSMVVLMGTIYRKRTKQILNEIVDHLFRMLVASNIPISGGLTVIYHAYRSFLCSHQRQQGATATRNGMNDLTTVLS